MGEDKQRTTFSLATNESYRNQQGERVDNTQWHNCVAWGKLGQNIQSLLTKGRKVAIQGKIAYGEYTGSDGAVRKTVDIVVADFATLDAKQQQGA